MKTRHFIAAIIGLAMTVASNAGSRFDNTKTYRLSPADDNSKAVSFSEDRQTAVLANTYKFDPLQQWTVTELSGSWRVICPAESKAINVRSDLKAGLAEDNGSIWIGMLGSGINIFNFTPPQDFYTNSLNDIQDRLQSNSVRSILIDSSNKMWLGIGTQHLVQIDMETGQWKCDKGIPGFENIPGYTVMAITQSRSTGKI